jgi:asparagine synthase (glutamine-hydrolysing)
MLWTTPESFRERLPLTKGPATLIADARIDNRSELIETLGLEPRGGEPITDAELILAAYEQWDEACPEKLIGDFSFAIWDRSKRALFCARDRLGVKPFYYFRSDRVFVFASEIKALLRLPDVPRQLNETRVAHYLASFFDDTSVTFYHDILRLPPAHAMTVDRGRAQVRSYWALDPHRALRHRSDQEYADGFREIFTEAVRCRLRTTFPVGAALSGGLDSSSVVCTAARDPMTTPLRRLRTFSLVFDGLPECNERSFINEVLNERDVDSCMIPADALSPLADLDHLLDRQDEPFDAPNLFLHWSLYRAAQAQGVRVFLDGLDGDTTVSHGMGYLTELARAGHWRALATELADASRRLDRPRSRLLVRHALRPLAPRLLRSAWRAVQDTFGSTPVAGPVLRVDFARRVGLTERMNAPRRAGSIRPRTEREFHHASLTSGVIPYALELADRAAASWTLEPRYPFFDSRLVEYCLALPPEQKLHRGWTRMVLRRAMGDILPAAIQWRAGKSNLGPNFVRQVRAAEPDMAAILATGAPALEGYVDLTALRRLQHAFCSRPTASHAVTLWKVAALATWLRKTNAAPTL